MGMFGGWGPTVTVSYATYRDRGKEGTRILPIKILSQGPIHLVLTRSMKRCFQSHRTATERRLSRF